MKIRVILALVIALAIGMSAGTKAAWAWGQTGHRVTSAIAERFLSDPARAAVQRILGSETLAEAATWPDIMRASPEEFWQKTTPPWHYVTVPDGKSYAEVGAPPEGDAVTALARFTATLKDEGASPAGRQMALRFVVHLVGDLHQPLHVGRPGDRGGNDVHVEYHKEPSNLHSVWDSGMINLQQLSYSEMAAWLGAKITPEQTAIWSSVDPQVWIRESMDARQQVYAGGDKLSYAYDFNNTALLSERLQKAGVRIAAYLNTVFVGN